MTREYRLNPHLGSGEVAHTLERDRLVVRYEKSGRTESIPFDAIREINLRQEMHGIYTAHVYRHAGKTLTIPSRHFRGIGAFDDRIAEYAPFVRHLLAACAEASPSTRLSAGSSILWGLGWVLLVVAVVFSVAVAVASWSRGLPPLRALFALPVAFVVGLGLVRQGRARAIDPANVPPEVLPA